MNITKTFIYSASVIVIVFCLLFSIISHASDRDNQNNNATEQTVAEGEEPFRQAKRFHFGISVSQVFAMTIHLYNESEKLGHNGARLNLGYIAYTKLSRPQDFLKARQWYKIAARSGDIDTKQNLDRMNKPRIGISQNSSDNVNQKPFTPSKKYEVLKLEEQVENDSKENAFKNISAVKPNELPLIQSRSIRSEDKNVEAHADKTSNQEARLTGLIITVFAITWLLTKVMKAWSNRTKKPVNITQSISAEVTARNNKVEGPLFRRAAVDAFSKRTYGRPIAKMPSSWIFLAIMLLAMVGVVFWFLITSTYSRKETVAGWLAPEEGLVQISVSQSAQVKSVLFEQGDRVDAGETLFILSQDKKNIQGSGTSEELLKKLEQEKNEIRSQILIDRKSLNSDLRATQKLINQLVLEEKHLRAQIQQKEEIVETSKELYERFRRLFEREDVSYLELNTQKEKYASQKQGLLSLKQRLLLMGREKLNAENALNTRPIESERNVSELNRRLIELSNKEIDLKSRDNQAVQSPISGTIATLEVKSGSTVYPQKLLASILPKNSKLFAEVYIPSRAIGFIRPGQTVRVQYAAFPYQRFGAAEGEVVRVSNTVLQPQEIPTAIGLEEPAYKAFISLEKQTMEGFGEVLPLRPSMSLTAEIILENRSFLDWLLEPLRSRRTS